MIECTNLQLELHSCDTIAECCSVSEDLYTALWNVLSQQFEPISEQIDIEESSPSDAIGLNTPKLAWEHFTDEQREELNRVKF